MGACSHEDGGSGNCRKDRQPLGSYSAWRREGCPGGNDCPAISGDISTESKVDKRTVCRRRLWKCILLPFFLLWRKERALGGHAYL